MKLIFYLILVITTFSSSLAEKISQEDRREWEKFKKTYARVYTAKDEEVHRMHIFMQNLKFIRDHNKKYAKEEESYSVKVNKFADLTNTEFMKTMNGYESRIKRRSNDGPKKNYINIPFSVDWRTKGAVTKVKDQGSCSSCWAFSATGSLEGQFYLKTKSLTSLSEQNLIDCSTAYGNDGCSGGVMNFAFKYVVKNKGIHTEESYPYEGRDGNCSLRSTKKLATASYFIVIPQDSELDLMEAVATVGPVSVAIDGSRSGFQFYSYGIYKTTYCSRTELNHAMLVVGYGTKSGRWFWDGDYWIVKNSWGTSWGMDGYIWIGRNLSNMCGIATEASYPVLL